MTAVRENNIPLVKVCLSWGVIFNYSEGSPNPLHLAVNSDNIDLIKLLINHPYLKTKDADGNTPAHLAAKNQQMVIYKMFKAKDSAMMREVNKNGLTPEVLLLEVKIISTREELASLSGSNKLFDKWKITNLQKKVEQLKNKYDKCIAATVPPLKKPGNH